MKTNQELVRYIGIKPKKPAGVTRASWRAAEQSRIREGRRRARAARWVSPRHGLWVLDRRPHHAYTQVIVTVTGRIMGVYGDEFYPTITGAMREEQRMSAEAFGMGECDEPAL